MVEGSIPSDTASNDKNSDAPIPPDHHKAKIDTTHQNSQPVEEHIEIKEINKSEIAVFEHEETQEQKKPEQPTEGTSNQTGPVIQKLGFTIIFLLTINAIFGSSLTYLPGLGVILSGPSSIIMWVLLLFVAIYIGMCIGELVAMYPTSGGIYEFSKQAYGPGASFIVGWVSWVSGNLASCLAIVWAVEYLFPVATTKAFLVKLAICLGLIIVLNLVIYKGLDFSTFMLATLAVITIIVLSAVMVPMFVDLPAWILNNEFKAPFTFDNYAPFFLHDGFATNLLFLFATLFIIGESFIGMESICYLAGETKNPKKTIPKALVTAISASGIFMLIYVIFSIGVFPFDLYSSALIPYKDLIDYTLQGLPIRAAEILHLGTYLFILAPGAGWFVTGPRLIKSLANDKLFPSTFAKIDSKTGQPTNAIIFQTVAVSFFTAFMYYQYLIGHEDPYKLIYAIFVFLFMLMMGAIIMCVPVLRHKHPDQERAYKAPFGDVLPPIIVVLLIISIFAWLYVEGWWDVLFKGITLLFLGIPVYMLLLLYYNPDIIIKVTGWFAFLTLWFENMVLPRSIRKQILDQFGECEGRTVLEFGANVGSMTVFLAEKVGKNGKIYATELSEGNMKLLQNRIHENELHHVTPIHDSHQVNRVHPDVGNVDMVISVGMLDYIQDLKKVLHEMSVILPENGKICFIEYADFFGVIPNSGWLVDLDKLKAVFAEVGFSVRVVKWKGFAWNYVCIYGIKSDEDVPMV